MWDERQDHWDDWATPLRPIDTDIKLFENELKDCKKILLLGATPELIQLATDNADSVTNGIDWFNMPYEKESFDAIIGDGVLTVVGPTLIDTVKPFIKKGGKLIIRVFLQNNSTKHTDNFLIKKFQGWNKTWLPVSEIYAKYGDTPTTKEYKYSDESYFFANLEDLPRPNNIQYPNYDFGEYFPVITWIV